MQEGAGHKLAAAGAAGQEVGGYADASTGTGSTISGLEFPRYFTTAGVDPFDEVEWELRDAVIGSERGKVTGTPVGCACGDGVIDWKKVIQIVRKECPRDIVLSVECGTVEQAERSIKHLKPLLK